MSRIYLLLQLFSQLQSTPTAAQDSSVAKCIWREQMSTDWQRSPFLRDAGIKNKSCWRPDAYRETKNTGEAQRLKISLVFLFAINKSENQTIPKHIALQKQ